MAKGSASVMESKESRADVLSKVMASKEPTNQIQPLSFKDILSREARKDKVMGDARKGKVDTLEISVE
jgi:hypothetical protein